MRRRTIKPRGRLSDALIDAGDVLFRLAAWIDPGPDGEPCPDCGVPTTVPLDEPCPECEVRLEAQLRDDAIYSSGWADAMRGDAA